MARALGRSPEARRLESMLDSSHGVSVYRSYIGLAFTSLNIDKTKKK